MSKKEGVFKIGRGGGKEDERRLRAGRGQVGVTKGAGEVWRY